MTNYLENLEISDTPDLKYLMQEFQRSGGLSTSSVKRDRADQIRFNRWDGRTGDYKKHRSALGRDPVPWEEAWDGRVFLADNIIDDLGDVLSTAFRRAQLQAKPTEAQDIERAGQISLVLNKYRERMPELNVEAEFLWQFGLAYGSSIFQVSWDRQVGMRMQRLSRPMIERASLAAFSQLNAMDLSELTTTQLDELANLAQLPTLIANPEREKEAGAVIQTFARELATALFSGMRPVLGDDFLANYELSLGRAQRVVRELREQGTAEFPTPYMLRNQPSVVARQVGYDYFAPPEMTDPDTSPWHAVRDWLSPEQILENVLTDGWDPDWADAAIKTQGWTSSWGVVMMGEVDDIDEESQVYEHAFADTKSGLVEVIWFYKRYVSKEGIPQIWCTIFSPRALQNDAGQDTWAKHFPTNDAHGKFPFVEFRWQRKRRNFHETLGVPELVGADQASIKRSLDMLVDRQELEVNPPWLVANRLAMRYKAGPGAQIPRKRKDDLEPAPPPSGSPEIAFRLIESAEKRVSNYFGLINEHVLPPKWQLKLQALTERYLGSCAQAFTMMLQLIQQHATDAELGRLLSDQPDFPRSMEEIQGQFDVALVFDVKDLDLEFVWKKLEALTKWAVPLDRAGIIDMAALARLIILAIDPSYARVLIQAPEAAGQTMLRQVKTDIALMALGNEAEYTEADPAAQIKLEFARQIIGANPKYQQALQSDQRFGLLMQKYEKNLMQSVKQEENKQIGRLGVPPALGPG